MAPKSKEGDIERLTWILTNGHYSDYTIRLEQHVWKTHRVVLSMMSGVFKTTCAGEFKEAKTQDVTLQDDNPIMLARLLVFVYAKDYPSSAKHTALNTALGALMGRPIDYGDEDGELTIHAALYGLGEKYDVQSLKALSRDNYITKSKDDDCKIGDLISSLSVAFGTTMENDDALSKWGVWKAQKHSELLASQPAFRKLMHDSPEFAFAFGTKYARSPTLPCLKCKRYNAHRLGQLFKCACGFSGMCEESQLCILGAAEVRKCGFCKGCGARDAGDETCLPLDAVEKLVDFKQGWID